VTYTLSKTGLNVVIEVTNTGEEILPVSIGAHPAFNWPLLAGLRKEAYGLTFSNQERAPVRRLKDGLLRVMPEPTPIVGKVLALSERLFDDDAVILDQPASTSVRYAADYGPSVEFPGMVFENSGSGRSLAALRFSASNLVWVREPFGF